MQSARDHCFSPANVKLVAYSNEENILHYKTIGIIELESSAKIIQRCDSKTVFLVI